MVAIVILSLALNASAEPVSIAVNVAEREDAPAPREFFGQFGEHLGLNVYNGQWAQILRNGSFEGDSYFEKEVTKLQQQPGLPDVAAGRKLGLACYWLPVGEASYALDGDGPVNGKLCQRVEVKKRGGLRTPVMLPLHRARRYDFRVYAWTTAGAKLSVSIWARALGAGGVQLCESSVRLRSAEWKLYEVRLRVPQGAGPGDLCYLTLEVEGAATVWFDQAELFPTDSVQGLDADIVRLMKDLRVSLVRFPGGNFASGYHWRDGIGPREKRPFAKNPAWDGWESNQFGTDDWMAFVEAIRLPAIGAEPLICVNCGNGTPEEAAEWVQYCNEPADGPLGKLRADNGHPEPYKVRYWELGNELWGDWQIGHCSPEEYAARYDAFAKAMLAVDPDLLLIANGGPGDWDERFLKTVKEPVRSLSAHELVGFDVPAETSAEDAASWLAAYGLAFEKALEAKRKVFVECGHPDAKVALTELQSVVARPDGPPTAKRQAEVLFFAGMMNACIRHRDFVEMITRSAVVNHGGGLAKVWEVVYPEPVHFLSEIYGTSSGRRPVSCKVKGPVYKAEVAGGPPIEKVPVLECLALLDDTGEELTLLVTNRDARDAHTATVTLQAFTPEHDAQTRTIVGPPDGLNAWDRPLAIKTINGETQVRTTFTYTFPPCSFTEIVLNEAG